MFWTIITSAINLSLVLITLFSEKIYNKIYGSARKHYEALKNIIGIICPIITLLISTISSYILIATTTDQSHLTTGYVNFVVAVIIAIFKLFFECKTFLKKEIEKENYKSFNGVFAVSAIIITKNKKFLLVKRKGVKGNVDGDNSQSVWVQPGVYYRTNTFHKDPPELLPLYDFLINSLHLECGLTPNRYTPIQLNSVVQRESPTFSGIDFALWNADFSRNMLSPTPFLIQIEKSDTEKRSNTSTHIDSFFAMQLDINDDELLNNLHRFMPPEAKYERVELFSYEEILKMCKKEGIKKNQSTYYCYPDLVVVMGQFLKLWRKELFSTQFKHNIRYCTFNPEKHTIWIRINEFCNLNCQFCLMQNKTVAEQVSKIDIEGFKSFWNKEFKFQNRTQYHLVITGGEPLLVENLYDIIHYAYEHSNGNINSISICTNGTLGTINNYAIENIEKILDNSCTFKSKLKFVINMSSYDSRSFREITCANNNYFFRNQCDFIASLQDNNVQIVANVVMTDILRDNLKSYFDFWKAKKIKDIAFSYSIQTGILHRSSIRNSIRTLSKGECLKLYNSLENGEYPIEHFDNIELMIPSCDEKTSCMENKRIESCFVDCQNNWKKIKGCLDI